MTSNENKLSPKDHISGVDNNDIWGWYQYHSEHDGKDNDTKHVGITATKALPNSDKKREQVETIDKVDTNVLHVRPMR